MTQARSLLRDLRNELRQVGDPIRAPRMQAYMKSKMPYHGVPAPLLRKTCRQLFEDIEFENAKKWQSQVLFLWREAKFREERYAAIYLSGHKSAKPLQTPAALKMYEEIIVSGAWWDYVDKVAIRRVGPIVSHYPGSMKNKMLSWSKSKDLWKRRTSIICQISLKDRLDLNLLYSCIEPSLGSKEFFLRKAIGWALREVAWRDPKEIRRYVRDNSARLSGLSQREALKNLGV